ncbi:hypothetical protein MHYP_G00295670 [Metynnis hypsauchen]
MEVMVWLCFTPLLWVLGQSHVNEMDVEVWLCFTLLLCSLGQGYGQTQFIYTEEKEVELRCETNKWQISTESDNKIDLNCTVKCDPNEIGDLECEDDNDDYDEDYGEDDSQPKHVCKPKVKSGFVACVKSLDAGFLFPFKPSPNTIHSYIVAVPNKDNVTCHTCAVTEMKCSITLFSLQ